MFGITPIEENEVGPMSSWSNDEFDNCTWNSGDENQPKKTFIIDIGEMNEHQLEDIMKRFAELVAEPNTDKDYFLPEDFSLDDEAKEITDTE